MASNTKHMDSSECKGAENQRQMQIEALVNSNSFGEILVKRQMEDP